MTTRNDITQDKIKSKASNQAYRDNHDRIFAQSYLKKVSEYHTIYRFGESTTEYIGPKDGPLCPRVPLDEQIKDIQELIQDDYK